MEEMKNIDSELKTYEPNLDKIDSFEEAPYQSNKSEISDEENYNNENLKIEEELERINQREIIERKREIEELKIKLNEKDLKVKSK